MSITPETIKKLYDNTNAEGRGYLAYMYAKWPNSLIPEENPYEYDTPEHMNFIKGVNRAVLEAQDSEE